MNWIVSVVKKNKYIALVLDKRHRKLFSFLLHNTFWVLAEISSTRQLQSTHNIGICGELTLSALRPRRHLAIIVDLDETILGSTLFAILFFILE